MPGAAPVVDAQATAHAEAGDEPAAPVAEKAEAVEVTVGPPVAVNGPSGTAMPAWRGSADRGLEFGLTLRAPSTRYLFC